MVNFNLNNKFDNKQKYNNNTFDNFNRKFEALRKINEKKTG